MTQPFKDELSRFYLQTNLTSEQLAQLRSLQQRPQIKKTWRTYLTSTAWVAASLLVALFIREAFWNTDRLGQIAEEIAYNHHKLMPMEVRSSSLQAIASGLSRLDFTLQSPERFMGGWNLVGGRYCSIEGRIAAQMRYDKNGTRSTLYTVPVPDGLEKWKGVQIHHVDGLAIELWIERDLLFGHAK